MQLVRGNATAEETAALVATLMAAAARSQSAEAVQQEPVRSNWNAPTRLLRAPLHPSPGGWRRSMLP
jgi:hypothetical protein